MLSPEILTAALNSQGLHFVIGDTSPEISQPITPAELLAGLAEQSDARLRLAIVALLLFRPRLSAAIPVALELLSESGQMTLKLFFTAAVLLQQIHKQRLSHCTLDQQPLPDLFSVGLGISSVSSPEARLQALGECHRQVSNLAANWTGTYKYAAERLMTRLEKEASWAI